VPLNALLKLVPLLRSKGGKLISPLFIHAALKFTLLTASVPSFAPAGNDVRAEQLCHEDMKLVQFLMSVVVKSLSDVLLYHAELTLVATGSSELKL